MAVATRAMTRQRQRQEQQSVAGERAQVDGTARDDEEDREEKPAGAGERREGAVRCRLVGGDGEPGQHGTGHQGAERRVESEAFGGPGRGEGQGSDRNGTGPARETGHTAKEATYVPRRRENTAGPPAVSATVPAVVVLIPWSLRILVSTDRAVMAMATPVYQATGTPPPMSARQPAAEISR